MGWVLDSRNVLAAVALAAVSACTTSGAPTMQTLKMDGGTTVATDSNLRLVLNTKPHATSRPGRVNPQRVICAEPSPDVASIVANSFGFGTSILQKGSISLSGQSGVALAQLAERTVTVQLLRDQMYRACEAYANGAISGTEYSLLMSRNNDAMVTLMLGESASRLVGRQLATLEASGNSSSNVPAPQQIEAADSAIKELQEAVDAQEDATKAEELEGAASAAAAATTQVSSDASQEETADDADAAEDNASEAGDNAEQQRNEADQATARYKELKTTAQTDAETIAGGFVNGVPELNEHAVGVAKELAEMQRRFLGTGGAEHFISACVVELGNTKLRNEFGFENLAEPFPEFRIFSEDETSEHNGDENSEDPERAEEEESRNSEKVSAGVIATDAYYDAEKAEADSFWTNVLPGRPEELTQDRLRAMVALEERTFTSLLALKCVDELGLLIDDEREIQRLQSITDMMVRVKNAGSAVALPAKPEPGQKPSPPKPDLTPSVILSGLAKYERCSKKTPASEVAACEIEVLGELLQISGATSISETSATDTGQVAIRPLSGSHLVRLASYKSEAAVKTGQTTVAKAFGGKAPDGTAFATYKSGSDFVLALGPFADKAKADAFCTANADKIKKDGGGATCVVVDTPKT